MRTISSTTRENAEGAIGTSFTHVRPGTLGGHEWNGGAYSPQLGALFVLATDWCAQMRQAERPPDPQPEKKRGQFFGGELQFDPWSKAQGWLTAFDAATGMRRWRYQSSKPMIGGVAVTGGGVVFTGEMTRRPRQAARRRRLRLRRRLQHVRAGDRRRKSGHHGLRAEIVTAGSRTGLRHARPAPNAN